MYNNMKKYINKFCRIIVLLFFCVHSHSGAFAQNVRVTTKQVNITLGKDKKTVTKKEEIPVGQQIVVGFDSKDDAEAFKNKLSDIPYLEIEDYLNQKGLSWGVTDNTGKVTIGPLRPAGRVVWIPSTGDDPIVWGFLNGECVIEQTNIQSDEGKMLGEVEAKGDVKPLPPDTISGVVIGKDIFRGRSPYAISPDYAKDNARFGLTPIFICIENPQDTLCFYRPFVKEGKNFHMTQSRRMEFDAVRHDTLSHERSLDTTYFHNHVPDTLWFQWHVRKRDINSHYRVLADYWCEDYNGAFLRDTIQIDHGRNINRLRFLDFKLDSMHIDIDKKRYHIEGKVQERNENLSLRLEFLYNSAELRAESTSNRYEIHRLLREFGSTYRGGSDGNNYLNSQSVVAVGIASPDGKEAGNKRLALSRANTVWNLIRDSLSYYERINLRDSIAPWSAVADTLLAMGDTVKAMEIRDIIMKYHTLDQQSQAVQNSRTLNYHGFLKEYVMPKFCVVKFSYRYLVKKVLDREDIIYKYEHEPEFRERDNKEHYQYEALFEYLKDRLPELEEQSKKAYFTLKEYDLENERYRPWPLAAYVYANALLKSGRKDLDEDPFEGILWPFLKMQYTPKGLNTVQERRDYGFLQYWNDEAIVATMVGMYFQSGDIMKARWIAQNYFNKSLQKTKYSEFMTFLNCYVNPEDPDIIRAVAKTSTFNKAVIYAAQNEKKNRKKVEPFLRMAINILQDSSFVNDHRALYMCATLKYRLYGPPMGLVGTLDPFIDSNIGKDEEEIKEDEKWEYVDFQLDSARAYRDNKVILKWNTWKQKKIYGRDMVRACEMHPEYLEELKWDGYFSDSYRKAFFFYFKRRREGFSDNEIKQAWYLENKKNAK